MGWESLQYALSHVRPTAPFLDRVRALIEVAAHQKELDKELVQVRCERGAEIARRIGLSEATAAAIHSLDEHWNGKGNPDGLRGEEIPLLARILNLAQTLDVFYTARTVRGDRNCNTFVGRLATGMDAITSTWRMVWT